MSRKKASGQIHQAGYVEIMKEDPIMQELRAVRCQLLKEAGGDL